MVQAQDDDYVQPEVTITTSSTEGGTTYTVYEKQKRTRKPWVYKEQYDNLNKKYRIAKYLALAGWTLAFILLSSCSSSVINGVRTSGTSTKIDPQTKFYSTVTFLIGAGITTHFYSIRH